jgi:hypothetical protein
VTLFSGKFYCEKEKKCKNGIVKESGKNKSGKVKSGKVESGKLKSGKNLFKAYQS